MGCGARKERCLKLGIEEEADILIVGGGIVGMAVALELRARGAAVTLLERAAEAERTPGQASWAAAGMLAAEDPHNPEALRELARYSVAMYDAFLARVCELSEMPVPFQTEKTVQVEGTGERVELAERSVDPRQLLTALETALEPAGVRVRRGFAMADVEETTHGVRVRSGAGEWVGGNALVMAAGAWSGVGGLGVRPRKGQMLRVRCPAGAAMDTVYRREDVYVVPRTAGPQAGTALIGATVEEAGFDTAVSAEALRALRARAAEMTPWVADEDAAPTAEAWAGLRPGTDNGLPLLGWMPGSRRRLAATGHFRNGILLAPGTAAVIADLVEGKKAAVGLEEFAVTGGSQNARADR